MHGGRKGASAQFLDCKDRGQRGEGAVGANSATRVPVKEGGWKTATGGWEREGRRQRASGGATVTCFCFGHGSAQLAASHTSCGSRWGGGWGSFGWDRSRCCGTEAGKRVAVLKDPCARVLLLLLFSFLVERVCYTC